MRRDQQTVVRRETGDRFLEAIAQLEKTLGVVLFDRTRRRVALTPAGEALLPDVRDLLARAQSLPARARAG